MGEGYSTRDVAKLVNLPEHRIRACVKAGLVGTDNRERARAGRLRRCRIHFNFKDLILLRTIGKLLAQGLSPRRVEKALARLRSQLSSDRPLTGVQLRVCGGRVVASDGRVLWEPESGQYVLGFEGGKQNPRAAAVDVVDAVESAVGKVEDRDAFVDVWRRHAASGEDSADYWFNLALEQEDAAPERARESYLRALAENPEHVEATINLGRLWAAEGDIHRAAAYFRQAALMEPTHPIAHFNLGVTLQDLDDLQGAAQAYECVLAHDPDFIDAHYNLAMLLEQCGDLEGAKEHRLAAKAGNRK